MIVCPVLVFSLLSSGQAGVTLVNDEDYLLGWCFELISCVFTVGAKWPLVRMNIFNIDPWLPYKDFTGFSVQVFP